MFFLISTAFADGSAQITANPLFQFVPIIAIFVVFYFFMIRPQNKKAQEHKDMLGSLKVNDMILTNTGIIGKIKKIQEGEMAIEVSSGVVIHMIKSSVVSIYTGPTKITNHAPVKHVQKKND